MNAHSMLRMALRNLTRQRRRTLLVLAAIGLGIAAVVGVRGFLNGLQSALVLSFAEGTIGAVQVHKAGFLQSVDAAPLTPNIDVTEDLLGAIASVEGVKAEAPRLAFPAMVSIGDETTFAFVVGVDPARELAACPRRQDLVVEGAWLAPGQSLIGMELLRALGGKAGSRAALIGNDADGVMNAADTVVGGALAAPTQGEKKLVLVPLATAQELVRLPGKATEIAVRVEDLKRVDDVAARLRTKLGPAYEVHTWKQIAAFAKDVIETQNAALAVITVIFLVVVMMGVANAMLTSVLERVREIGTMMAVGARRRQILTMFVIESALLGWGGAALGVVVGSVVIGALGRHGVDLTTPGASVATHLVPFVELPFLARMVALSVAGAALAALWPAWRASRLKPVDALGGSGA